MIEGHYFETSDFCFSSRLDTTPPIADFDTKTKFSNHMHSQYEIFFFLQGDVDYFVGNSFYRLHKNDLLIIPPTVYHYPKFLSSNLYHRIWINFTKAHLSKDLQTKIADLNTYYKVPADNIIIDLYKQAVLSMDRYEKQDIQSSLIHYLNLILTEITYLDKTISNDTTQNILPLLKEILAFIDKHLNLPLNLNFIANEFSISQTWLTHFFKKHMKISVMQYITYKKILQAQQYIENGDAPTIVANQMGFENYATFYNQYKKVLGKSPTKLKN